MYRYTAEILIAIAAEKGASDVHLIAGLPPKCRIDGQIRSLTDEPLSYEDGESGSICFARRVRFPLRCDC